MGLIFENLIRRFNELANETAGDHFTPREVIRLMVSILFIQDDKLLATPGTVRKLLDPACGTGGMLAEAQNYLREHHGEAKLYVYGQDYNKRAFAIAASDMLMKQVDHNGGGNNIRFGDTFIDDQFAGETFDYFLTNPPFGVDWKRQQKEIQREHRADPGPARAAGSSLGVALGRGRLEQRKRLNQTAAAGPYRGTRLS
jgi:type I restriction enzyme M protein